MAQRIPFVLLGVEIGVLCLATVFHIIGMSTPYWRFIKKDKWEEYDTFYQGLFEICTSSDGYSKATCVDVKFEAASMKYQVLQVMAYFGLVGGLTSVVSAIIFLVVQIVADSASKSRKLIISFTSVTSTASLLSALFILTIVCIFGFRVCLMKEGDSTVTFNKSAENDLQIGYSFILCIVSLVLFVVGTILTLVTGKKFKSGTSSRRTQRPSGRRFDNQDGGQRGGSCMITYQA